MNKIIRDIVVMGKKVTPEVQWWLAGGVPAANCIGAWQGRNRTSYTASKINRANPGTYDLYEGGAPSWDGTLGWTGGTNKFLLTGITPANANAKSFIVRVANRTGTGLAFGSYLSGPALMGFYYSSANNCTIGTNGMYNLTTTDENEVLAACKAAGQWTAEKIYKDGNYVADGTAKIATPTAIRLLSMDGTTANFSNTVVACAYYDIALSASQVAAITEAMNLIP